MYLNGKRVAARQLATQFPMVIFSPESLSSIKEGPEQRRKLIDELVTQIYPGGLKVIEEYAHCLQSRNRLLREYQESQEPKQIAMVLDSLDVKFKALALELTLMRLQAIHEFKQVYQQAAKRFFSTAKIELNYEISDQKTDVTMMSRLEANLEKRMAELRVAERASGVSLVGPHKHDIKFLYDDNDSRFYCSQGEQRCMILAFKMAQIVYHHRVHEIHPLLLLDDVLSELDKQRRADLVTFLLELKSQILLTTTDIEDSEKFAGKELRIFEISSGEINLRS